MGSQSKYLLDLELYLYYESELRLKGLETATVSHYFNGSHNHTQPVVISNEIVSRLLNLYKICQSMQTTCIIIDQLKEQNKNNGVIIENQLSEFY